MTPPPSPQRVLVTGGSRGIGRAVVLACAERGADVLLTYRTDRADAEDAARCAESFGVDAEIWQLDMADSASISEFEVMLSTTSPIDAAVLNAGIWAGGRVGVIDDETWLRVVLVNLYGTYLIARAVLPTMRLRSAASITMISSVIGIRGFEGDTAYGAAKGGMITFAKALAKEVAPDGMRVNVIAPGFVETDMTSGVGERAWGRLVSEVPLGRPGLPEEIALGATFLIFDGTYVTGTVLTIDGGWSSR
jgi:3-oxoacyl-[acyl-carrier protein] reductase